MAEQVDVPRIGVFDSGIGGLGILKEISRFLSEKELFYIADQAYCPYGNRTSEEIKKRCFFIVEELLKKKVDMVVIACNTATVTALPFLRKKFSIPIMGIEPRVDYARENNLGEESSLLVLTTPVTGKSSRFFQLKKKVDPQGKIDHLNCPNLARIVENFFENSSRGELYGEVEKEFISLKGKKYTHVILGCTHYEHIPFAISDILKAQTVGSGEKVAAEVAAWVERSFPSISNRKLTEEENKKQKFLYMTTVKGDWVKRDMRSWMDKIS
ncbi:MAG: glutamate racemase [Halobacteriovoraceae bacterium]|nr:glutamate racemase [Halobacteriovoraceae bacterium]